MNGVDPIPSGTDAPAAGRVTLVPAGDGSGWTVTAPTSAAVLGRLTVTRSDAASGPADVELTGALEAAARGRGYGAEALRLAAADLFANGSRRLILRCPLDRPETFATALAAGFGFEGVERGDPGVARFARLAADPGRPISPAFARMAPPGISDGVLLLRPLTAADADGWLEGENDELTIAWGFTGRAPGAPELAALARAGLDWVVGTVARMAVLDLASGRVAGTLQIRLAGPPQVGGIGYVIAPSFRGRGYAARALRLLAPWAFGVAGFVRLELGAKRGNVASQRAALAAGFAPDGVRRSRLRTPVGGFDDEVRFDLLATDPPPELTDGGPSGSRRDGQEPSRITPYS